MLYRIVFVACISMLFSDSITLGENWGHWRGPSGNGVGVGNPPIEWSTTKNVKWKVAIPGLGSGSPVIWNEKIFVVTSVPSNKSPDRLQFQIHCIDRMTGKTLWQQTSVEAVPHQETHNTNNHASASPCTDGEHVYAYFGSRGLYCYTMDGNLVWKRDFGDMQTRNNFGEGSSPTISGNTILIPWDHEGPSALYALDKLTGETIWEAKRDEPTCWSTPLVVDHQGKKQVVMNGERFARGYDLATGKELWRCSGQTQRPCASAVAKDNMVFVGSGFRGAFLGAFKLDGQGDITGTNKVVWTVNRDTPDVASPTLSENRIYFYKGKSGQLSCVDAATGKPFYLAERIPGMSSTYASPVAAGGKVYLSDRSGKIVVIEDSERLKILATNSMEETVDATLAVVDDELFIRGDKHLFCIAKQ